MSEQKFLIDTNSFIAPYRQYYAFDFTRAFWEQLEQNINDGKIVMLDMVPDEILCVNDELKDWGKKLHREQCIDHREPQILLHYREIMQYLQDCPYYKQTALDEWAIETVADPWLIAAAKAHNCAIVTFEMPNTNPNARQPWKMPKIPNVANEFGVQTENLFSMMRTLQFRL